MIASALLFAIRVYRASLSHVLPTSCRFQPTCSQYAMEAIEVYGPWRGVTLVARRLGRCRPGGGSGYDPVPSRSEHGPGVQH